MGTLSRTPGAVSSRLLIRNPPEAQSWPTKRQSKKRRLMPPSRNTSHNGVQHNDCLDQDAAEANSITAAEINEGSNGQRRQVCVFTAELDESGEQIIGEDGNAVVSFKETTVEFSDCEPSHS